MPTLGGVRRAAGRTVESLDHALGRLARPLAALLPRRLRRVAEKMERQRGARPAGQLAAAAFLLAAILYGLAVGGQIGRLGDSLLVAAGFGIETVSIQGNKETSEISVLERLELGGSSLISFNVASARERVAALPWVAHATVRKAYPDTLVVTIEERQPYALWQDGGEIFVIDRAGTKIVPLEDHRFAAMPFVVGSGANENAAGFLPAALGEPAIAERLRASVLVAGRRWDIHLENGLTVKLPEKAPEAALTKLVRLDAESQILSRDVVVVDLRLPDRITVRLPEGRTLEEVTGEPKKPGDVKKAKIKLAEKPA